MPIDAEAWARARSAKARLEQSLLHDPAVALIDIGLSSGDSVGREGQELVLRVHVRASAPGGAPAVPASVDGVPVTIVPGDYRLEDE